MKYLFVLNPKSFGSPKLMDQVFSEINGFFKKAGSEDHMIYVSQFPRDAVSMIRSFAGSMRQDTTLRVYAVGGDGILFDCLNGVMGFPNVELGAIPYGHSNSFLRGFGRQNLPLFRNIASQVSAPAIPVDVMRSGTRYALNFCTVGIESEAVIITQRVRNYLRSGGPLAQWFNRTFYERIYFMSALPAIFNRRELHRYYDIDLDGEDLSGNYRGINAANGSWYAGTKCPVRSARPDDGLVDVLFARAGGPFRTLSLVPAYLNGNAEKFPRDFMVKRGRRLTIRSGYPLVICFDDLIFFDSSLTVELLPGALRFVDAGGQGYRGALRYDKRR
jgi:diacylglycerol kinase family enzyme